MTEAVENNFRADYILYHNVIILLYTCNGNFVVSLRYIQCHAPCSVSHHTFHTIMKGTTLLAIRMRYMRGTIIRIMRMRTAKS